MIKHQKKTKKDTAKGAEATEGAEARYVHTIVDHAAPETEALIQEHAELETRIRTIEERIGTPTAPSSEFLKMAEVDRILLLNQLAAMSTYEYNLNIRVSRAVARDAEAQQRRG